MLSAARLADKLGCTRQRISQLVAEGKLDGAFTGTGRARRFDLDKSLAALNRRLDVGQQTGNGVQHLARRVALAEAEPAPLAADDTPEPDDARAILIARRQALEIEVRRKLREEQLSTGRYVLAEEADRATRAAVAETLAAAERFLVAEARRAAQAAGLDPRAAAAEARARWRTERARQAETFALMADAAAPTEAEHREMADA